MDVKKYGRTENPEYHNAPKHIAIARIDAFPSTFY